ncbi:IS21 family transposase [Ferrimicrobium sp.]|uniref:IS21 family transposase n=1 Tax=Ferrimicrobium sp. TaxID=2926050 RepID=UPI002614B196|nr:IS21 family transposase [Ferrimicrobium sp.]
MAKKKETWGVEMNYVREVIRLHYELEKNRNEIAQSLGISHATVTRILSLAGERGVELLALSDTELKALMYPNPAGPKPSTTKAPIDFAWVLSELGRKSMTRALLYQEYAKANEGGEVYSYSNFCAQLREYQQSHQVTMVLTHTPGEVCYLDYAGMTIPIYDAITHMVLFCAQILVATLAYSGYTYAEAQRAQSEECFVNGIARALSFFGGVVATLVPDNLKAGVISHTKRVIRLSRAIVELASYYHLWIDPTRVRRPRDKAKVEERVKAVQNWVLAPLRDEHFTSLAALNEAIARGVKELNDRPFTKMEGSRSERFCQERPYLRPLPETPFSYGRWLSLRVPPNYHLIIGEVSYSVPYVLTGKTVEVRITEGIVEIFHAGQRVASHQRSYRSGEVMTDPAHLHPKHAAYLDSLSSETLKARLIEAGPSVGQLAELLGGEPPFTEGKRHSLTRLLDLYHIHGADELEAACGWALANNTTSLASLVSILTTKVYLTGDQPAPPVSPIHDNLRHHDEFTNTERRV